jgi:hypothetical protein
MAVFEGNANQRRRTVAAPFAAVARLASLFVQSFAGSNRRQISGQWVLCVLLRVFLRKEERSGDANEQTTKKLRFERHLKITPILNNRTD